MTMIMPVENAAVAIRRPLFLPKPDHLVAHAEYAQMRSALTEIVGLGFALRASVSDDELRVMVSEACERALGSAP